MLTDTVNVLCNKLLWQNHGNVLQHSSKVDFFPSCPIGPHQMIDIYAGLCGGGGFSVSLSTNLVEPVAVTVANTTSTQWKSVPCVCFHSALASCTGQSLRSLLKLYEAYLSSDSVVNTLPYAAWRISNWEHMVPCSSPFVVGVVCFLHVPTRTPYSYTHSTFSCRECRFKAISNKKDASYDAFLNNKIQPV